MSRSVILSTVLLLAVLCLAVSVAWSIAHPAGAVGKAGTSLVALQPVNEDAAISPFETDRHRSASISNFDAGSSQTWHVELAYQGCPSTQTGAIRLTVYTTGGPATKRIQYSRTLVDWNGSDSATYVFPGKSNREFLYQVDVPSAHGCRAWSIAGETN